MAMAAGASLSIIPTTYFKEIDGLSSHLPLLSTSSSRIRFISSTGKLNQAIPVTLKPVMHTLKIEAAKKTSRENRIARHVRIRKKVEGTTERPRLAVFRSNKHLYCQGIDDTSMHTLASASTMQKPLSEELNLTSGPTIGDLRGIFFHKS